MMRDSNFSDYLGRFFQLHPLMLIFKILSRPWWFLSPEISHDQYSGYADVCTSAGSRVATIWWFFFFFASLTDEPLTFSESVHKAAMAQQPGLFCLTLTMAWENGSLAMNYWFSAMAESLWFIRQVFHNLLPVTEKKSSPHRKVIRVCWWTQTCVESVVFYISLVVLIITPCCTVMYESIRFHCVIRSNNSQFYLIFRWEDKLLVSSARQQIQLWNVQVISGCCCCCCCLFFYTVMDRFSFWKNFPDHVSARKSIKTNK